MIRRPCQRAARRVSGKKRLHKKCITSAILHFGYIFVIKITQLCRIAKNGCEFYYVPAYFFFIGFYSSEDWRAQYHWDDTHEGERRVIEQRNGNVGGVSGYFDEYNAIVINALDGTLIDLGKGY